MKDFFGKVLSVGDYASIIPEYGMSIKGGTIVKIIATSVMFQRKKVRIATLDSNYRMNYRGRSLIKQEIEDLI